MEFYSVWSEASRDLDAETNDRLHITARVASAPVWPFLANARTRADFESRLEYAAERLYQAAEAATRGLPGKTAGVYEALLESLRADFEILAKEWKKPWEDHEGNDDDDEEGDKESKSKKDENDSPNENDHDSDSDEDDNDDDDAAGKKKHKDEDDGDGDPSPADKKDKNPFGKKKSGSRLPLVEGAEGTPLDHMYDERGVHDSIFGKPMDIKGLQPREDGSVDSWHGGGIGTSYPSFDEAVKGIHPGKAVDCPHCKTDQPMGQGVTPGYNYYHPKTGQKTAGWIIVNEKSKRRVKGPFPSKPAALDVLKGLGEGYQVEMEEGE